MNAEYASFFDIGMVERNEVNAIIVHGTMCLIRHTAMGGWSSDTVCEDSDLGLTILELGWRAHYANVATAGDYTAAGLSGFQDPAGALGWW
jgi:cellulose synthase/poly-beta-1,6-N-acetylglucosamine synthase-like glycosyltransferase